MTIQLVAIRLMVLCQQYCSDNHDTKDLLVLFCMLPHSWIVVVKLVEALLLNMSLSVTPQSEEVTRRRYKMFFQEEPLQGTYSAVFCFLF